VTVLHYLAHQRPPDDMAKQDITITNDVGVETDQDASSVIKEIYRGTSADQHDMDVLGVKQVLRRNYRLLPMLGFSSIAVISWEVAPLLIGYVLVDGGPAAMFWGLVIGAVGFFLVYASLAEVASMFPTAGGQVSLELQLLAYWSAWGP
jgi:choline transport protein